MIDPPRHLRLVEDPAFRTFARTALEALMLARARVRCQASANQHSLSGWRPDPERPGFELATCDRCQAGVSINLGQAQESLSDELLTPCSPARRVWRPW